MKATYQPVSEFPAVTRDLSVVVPDGVTHGAVVSAIWSVGGAELEAVQLQDIYRGEGIPDTARVLTYRLRFRSMERTLDKGAVDAYMLAVVQKLAALDVTLRGGE